MISKHIKNYSELYANKKIKKVVIGFPSQREDTIKAAKNVGFEDIKLINEPTAAAIHMEIYGN